MENKMRVVCAWCKTILVDAPAGSIETHGICDACTAKYFPDDAPQIGDTNG